MKLAPDIFYPSVHSHENRDPKLVAIMARNRYKMRLHAAKLTPRDYALNWIRHCLYRGWQPDDLLDSDMCSSAAYVSVSCGPACAGLRKGKVKVKAYGHEEQIFSMVELIVVVERERNNRSLFK